MEIDEVTARIFRSGRCVRWGARSPSFGAVSKRGNEFVGASCHGERAGFGLAGDASASALIAAGSS